MFWNIEKKYIYIFFVLLINLCFSFCLIYVLGIILSNFYTCNPPWFYFIIIKLYFIMKK